MPAAVCFFGYKGLYLQYILTNTESVSLFPNRERRKFIWVGDKRMTCLAVSVHCGYGRRAVAYFIPKGTPTTYDSKIGFRHYAFLFLYVVEVRAT